MINKIDRNEIRLAKHIKLRQKISGTTEKPRFNIFRSDKHIYVQIIDDVKGVTIASASTVEKEIAEKTKDMKKKEASKVVGEIAAKRAIEKGVTEVVFDRGSFVYTGRVAEVAEGARAAGLKF